MKICSQEVSGCMFAVVVVQIITWMVVSALLFYRGIYNLWIGKFDINLSPALNRTSSQIENPAMKGYSAGVVILFIASLMMLIGPIFLIVIIVEKCYRKRNFVKLPQEDLPPKYEDVMMEDMAPRYSSLYLNSDDLENNHTFS